MESWQKFLELGRNKNIPGLGDLIEYNEFSTIADHEVCEFVGLAHQTGAYYVLNVRHALTLDNDDYELTFNQIADIIEYEPEGLFND